MFSLRRALMSNVLDGHRLNPEQRSGVLEGQSSMFTRRCGTMDIIQNCRPRVHSVNLASSLAQTWSMGPQLLDQQRPLDSLTMVTWNDCCIICGAY